LTPHRADAGQRAAAELYDTDEHGSPLYVSGEISVHARQVGAINISLQATDFEVIDNELGDVGLDAPFIGGEFLRPRVVGDIRVTAAGWSWIASFNCSTTRIRSRRCPTSYRLSGRPNRAEAQEATRAALVRLGWHRTRGAAGTPPKAPASQILADTLAMDVQLRIPDNLVVRGNNLRPGGPTRAALGDPTSPWGRSDPQGAGFRPRPIRDGEYSPRVLQFQGRTFDLVRDGTIRFVGQTPPNPIIDVTASRTIPDTGVEARAAHRDDQQPELSSSVPPLDESDILRSSCSIDGQRAGDEPAIRARRDSRRHCDRLHRDAARRSVGRALDLDPFEITTTSEGDSLGAGSRSASRSATACSSNSGNSSAIERIVSSWSIPADGLLESPGLCRPGNVGHREPHRPAPHRAGGGRWIFFSY
jgi:hypothetical protein